MSTVKRKEDTLETYYYSEQLRRYEVQFAAVFAGLKVDLSEKHDGSKLIRVPIKNASSDRVVAYLKADNTHNKPLKLPLMTYQLVNIDLAPEMRKGVGIVRSNTYMPSGGIFPDDIEVVEQRQPVPYRTTIELTIWASNQDQHYQIVEQIVSLFDPILQIQTSDELFDWTRLTTIELVDIAFSENVGIGTEKRIIQTRLVFSMMIYLALPTKIHKNYIKEINMRIGALTEQNYRTVFDILADLDSQGAEYETIFSLDQANEEMNIK